MDEQNKNTIIAVALIAMLAVTGTALFSTTSVSGYQSMTANWYKVHWPNAQGSGDLFELDLRTESSPNPTVFLWDADNTEPDVPDGMSDLNTYSGEIESLKFDRNINYNDWWLNDTVSASNPEGTAQHFEWAIDIYTMNVNFYADAGTWYAEGLEIWAEIQNNYDSVFDILGAEAAVSYVLYAETSNYSWAPEDAGWHKILPAVGNFEITFMGGGIAVPPSVPEEGSDLNFAALEPYSHISIPFTFTQFGMALWGSACTVNMVVSLNVLTIGRFDYVLTYVEAGENEIGPVGPIGLLAGIGAALGAGYGALMDGFSDILPVLTPALIAIAVIVIGITVIYMVIKRG